MSVNRGKQFEDVIKQSFDKVEGIVITRLHDQTNGYMGSKNPCDFMLYRKPMFMAIECKSVHGNTLPFSNITDYQWEQLLLMSQVKGVVAGVICWWIDKDVTMFMPIQYLQACKDAGDKSVRYDCIGFEDNDRQIFNVEIYGKKKRVFFDYDMQLFLDTLEGFYETGT